MTNETIVRIKLRIFNGDIELHKRNFKLFKQTNQYYFFEEEGEEGSELFKVKINDFGSILKTRSSDTESIFFRDAWVFEEEVDNTSRQMLKDSQNHFKSIIKICENTLESMERFFS